MGLSNRPRHLTTRVDRYAVGECMSTAEPKQKTLFLNGIEVGAIEPTGNPAKDLEAARKFLAEKGIGGPQERLTLRTKRKRTWRKKSL